MLSSKTGTYASAGLPASQDETGSYLPDAVIAPLLEQAQKVTPQVFETQLARGAAMTGQMPLIKDPQISYEKSKELILQALTKFDPALAQKAREIFDAGYDSAIQKNFIEDLNEPSLTEDPSRWRLRQVAPGTQRIMRSIEAKSEKTDLDPSNPNAKSVIQFEYDGTINSTIYLAHELGHSMADDFIRDKDGHKFGNNPRHMDEFQAYFIQNIVAEDLKQNPDPAIAQAAQEHFKATMEINLYQLPLGLAAMEAQKDNNSNDKTKTLNNWFGDKWAQYAPAQKAAQEITDTKISCKTKYMKSEAEKKLDDGIDRFHSRPVSILLASGLVSQLQQKSPEERRKVGETLLGKDGPKNLCDVMASAGIQTAADAQDLSRLAVQKTALSIMKAPAIPLNQPSAKPLAKASL